MKHLYHMLMVLFLGTASLQQPFAAAAAVESPEAPALRAACHQVLDDIRTTLISREEYMAYLVAYRAEISTTLPPAEAEDVNTGITYWVEKMQDQNDYWQSLARRVEHLEAEKYDLDLIRNLISDFTWYGFVQTINMKAAQTSYYGFSLLKRWPDAKKVHEEDARILGGAIAALLPFMSESYQRDYEMYKLHDVSTLEYKDSTGFSILVPDVGAIRHGDMLQVTTKRGIRFTHPLLEGMTVSGVPETADPTKFSLMYTMRSGFIVRIGSLPEEEVAKITRGFSNAAEQAMAETAKIKLFLAIGGEMRATLTAGRGKKREAIKARRAEEVSLAVAAAAAATPEALAVAAKAEAELLETEAVGKSGGKGGKAARRARAAAHSSAATVEGACASAVSNTVESAGGSGGSVVADEVAADAASASAAVIPDTAAAGAGATKKGGARPPHQVTVPVVDPSGKIDRTHSTRTGPKQTPIDTLTVLLGESLEGTAFTSINTVHWDEMVGMLEGLGFTNKKGGLFTNAQNHRLNLHALHYDEYRMNYDLRRILFRQLALYGFTEDRLKGLLAGPSVGVGSA